MSAPRRDLLASLLPITRALRRIEDEAAAAQGLTMWQCAILAALSGTAGDQQLNQREVADLLDYSRNRIVADLDLLEQRTLILRRPGVDRRSNLLILTASGAARMRAIRADVHAGEDALLAGLPAGVRAALGAVAIRVSDHLRTH